MAYYPAPQEDLPEAYEPAPREDLPEAYLPAPQEDLPEVVSATGWQPQEECRSPGEYESYYGQQIQQTRESLYGQDRLYRHQSTYEPEQPYRQTPLQERDPSYYQIPRKSVGPSFPRDVANRPLPNYKPAPLRWLFLGSVVAIILGYMALTGYALQKLPRESSQEAISDFADLKRQLDASPSSLASEVTVASPQDMMRALAWCESDP